MKKCLKTQEILPIEADFCLYANKSKNLSVIIHIDDIQVMGLMRSKAEILMNALNKKHKLKAVNIDLFIGININNPSKNMLKMSQQQYAQKLLERHGMENCKVAKSKQERIMEPRRSETSAQLKLEYNSIITELQNLAKNTLPEISNSVNYVVRLLLNP